MKAGYRFQANLVLVLKLALTQLFFRNLDNIKHSLNYYIFYIKMKIII